MPNSKGVLVIDDDSTDRERIRRLLKGHYTIDEASTAAEGYQKALDTPYLIALLDYRLPDSFGVEVLPKFLALDIPVIMLTGQGNEAIAVEAMKLGASDYLMKDSLTLDQLLMAIDRALERERLRFEIADRQRELEDFAHAAAHDLNAPLFRIKQSSVLLQEYLQDNEDPTVKRLAGIAVNGASQMAQLIKDLLEYSRVGRLQVAFGAVDLNVVLEKVKEALAGVTESVNGKIISEPLPTICGDQTAIFQLFQNIISNGLKFHGPEAPVVRVTAEETPDSWLINISDNGIGIAPEHHTKIFKAFERLHSRDEYEGSGIGLATCRKVVNQHKGEIGLRSEIGKGTTFLITLPKTQQS